MANYSARKLATSRRRQWQATLLPRGASQKLGGAVLPSIVVDTNVWYSAIVYGGAPEQAIVRCLERYQLVFSDALIEELLERLKRKAQAPYRWVRHLRLALEQIGTVVAITDPEQAVRDPKDNHVVAAALAAHCRFIVTGDQDLLKLGEYQGVIILRPVEFLELSK